MPKIWVKWKDPALGGNVSVWAPVKRVYIWSGGSGNANVSLGRGWTIAPKKIYVNQSGINKLAYPDFTGNTAYTVPGVYYYTVPNGITSLQFVVGGAGGGGGGNDSPGVGHPGYAGNIVTFTSNVTPGNVYLVGVGHGGGAGSGGGGAAGGTGGATTGLFKGGTGGTSGGTGSSGSGGGGGEASYILEVASNTAVTGSNVAVAGGGGGGGGGGHVGGVPVVNGQPQSALNVNPVSASTSNGAAGQNKSGDGGGGGGGGGGYLLGGNGGGLQAGDQGGYSGLNGGSLIPLGGSANIGLNGAAATITGGGGFVYIFPQI
jgi:hypothetical protein